MRFTFKRQTKPAVEGSAEGILQKQFIRGYAFVQSKWARWMAKKTKNWSRKKLMVVSVLFFTVSGAYSMYLIIGSLTNDTTQMINIDGIAPPLHAIRTGEGIIPLKIIPGHKELERIAGFRKYMDSLSRSQTGRKVYDSIAAKRPGLMDSLKTIEHYYKLNFKN